MPAVGPRLRSWWWDYVVVAAWLLILLVVFGSATALGWIDLGTWASQPAVGDAIVAFMTVVPYLVYLVWTEAGATHATWGKRRSGLTVRAATGASPGQRDVLIRNLVKVAPWQLGHMAAMRFATATDAAAPTAAVAYFGLSLGLLCAVAGPPLLQRRGVHDVVAGTVVLPLRTRR